MIRGYLFAGLLMAAFAGPASAYDARMRVELEPLIVKHAAANKVPAALVHRIIVRESRYNPRAVGQGGALGLMQIKHETARALGYRGPASGLLDAETNLAFGVRYLAGAYRVADGDQDRAVGFYARGYYYDAKRKGLLGVLAKAPQMPVGEVEAEEAPPEEPRQTPSLLALLFMPRSAAEPQQDAPVPVRASEPEDMTALPAEAPLPPRRSAHLGRPAGSGGDRAARTASAPPDGPDRRP
jgi:hypothetical protein